MAFPYVNSHSLNSDAKKVYGAAMSNSGSVLNGGPQRSGVVFGLKVQQTAPNNYLNTLNPYGESFHNPFSDDRFPKVLVRVLYHQEPTQRQPSGLSDKTRAQQSDENILYNSQSGLRIDRVWSMAVKANSQSDSINASHSPLDSTLKDTTGNGSSGTGRSTPQISSVVDNTSQKAYEQSKKRQASRKAYEQSEKRQASRKAYEQSEKRKASQKAYRESDKGRACQKAYRQSGKERAYQKAYRQSDKGKASRKAYLQSEKGRASRKAYEQSKKRKAYQKAYQKAYVQSGKRKAYEQSKKRRAYHKAYQKAYYKVFNKTGDKEQAKIAGRQATALMRKSNEAKKSELESISISSLTPRLSG